MHKRGFLVHRNAPKGNEDETEIADTTNGCSQGNQGHSPSYAQAIFGGRKDPHYSGRIRRDQLTSAFQRALPETGREIALRIAFAATFGPIYAWYVLARAIMRLWPERQEAGAAVRLLIQA